MSLINEMLRDLENRRGPAAPPMDRALDGLNSVGAWAEGPGRSLPWTLLAGIGVVAAAVALRPAGWTDLTNPAVSVPETAEIAAPLALPTAAPTGVTAAAARSGGGEITARTVEPEALGEAMAVPPLAPPRSVRGRDKPAPEARVEAAAQRPANGTRERFAEAARITDELRAEAQAIEAMAPAVDPQRKAQPATSIKPAAHEEPAPSTVEHAGSFRRQHSSMAAPTAGEVELARARNLLQGGDRARGLIALKAYVLGHPRAHGARLLFARELLKDGRRTEAEAVLRSGLGLAPRHTAFAQLLAHLMFDDHRSAMALEVLRAASPPVAVDPEYHGFMAAICQQLGQHAAALGIYRGIVAAHPAHGSATLGMAISLAALGDAREAAGAFRQAATDSTLSRAVREYALAEAHRLGQVP